VTYLRSVPKAIPPGQVLVHNTVRPTRRLGSRGFRAWLSVPDRARLEGLPLSVGAGVGTTLPGQSGVAVLALDGQRRFPARRERRTAA
jgi:hypothetical protein